MEKFCSHQIASQFDFNLKGEQVTWSCNVGLQYRPCGYHSFIEANKVCRHVEMSKEFIERHACRYMLAASNFDVRKMMWEFLRLNNWKAFEDVEE